MEDKHRPELIIGLVGPLGIDLDQIYDCVNKSLQRVKYSSEKITLGESLSEIAGLENPEKNDT